MKIEIVRLGPIQRGLRFGLVRYDSPLGSLGCCNGSGIPGLYIFIVIYVYGEKRMINTQRERQHPFDWALTGYRGRKRERGRGMSIKLEIGVPDVLDSLEYQCEPASRSADVPVPWSGEIPILFVAIIAKEVDRGSERGTRPFWCSVRARYPRLFTLTSRRQIVAWSASDLRVRQPFIRPLRLRRVRLFRSTLTGLPYEAGAHRKTGGDPPAD